MIWILGIVELILWVIGYATGTGGMLIHILLVLAAIVFTFGFLTRHYEI
jgi:hypothetical protein